MNTFFDRFNELCRLRGETPNYVAKLLNISSGSVTAWKQRGIEPRAATVSSIASYFDVPIIFLLPGDSRVTDPLKLKEFLEVFLAAARETNQTEAFVASRSNVNNNFFAHLKTRQCAGVLLRDLLSVAAYLGVTEKIIEIMSENKKAPTQEGERTVNDDDIKFALFGGSGEITDAMFEEVRQFAAFVKKREEKKKKE